MGQLDKVLAKILSGASDANINFSSLCNLITKFGFVERIKGDHFIYSKDGQARHYFCESLFWASQPKQAAKITWQLMPTAPRFVLRSCHCVTSLQARCRLRDTTSNDLTAFRM